MLCIHFGALHLFLHRCRKPVTTPRPIAFCPAAFKCDPLKDTTGMFEDCFKDPQFNSDGLYEACTVDMCNGNDNICKQLNILGEMCRDLGYVHCWRPVYNCGKSRSYTFGGFRLPFWILLKQICTNAMARPLDGSHISFL